MNKLLLVSAMSAVVGLSSCGDETADGSGQAASSNYTVELTAENLSLLKYAMENETTVSPSASSTNKEDGILARAAFTLNLDCEDSGHMTITVDIEDESAPSSVVFSNCEEEGLLLNGEIVMHTSYAANGNLVTEAEGNYTMSMEDPSVSFTFSDLEMTSEEIESDVDIENELVSMEMTADVSIVSDVVSGTFGMYGYETPTTMISTMNGANGTTFTSTTVNGVETCELNDVVVDCNTFE